MDFRSGPLILLLLFISVFIQAPSDSVAGETPQQWEVLNPSGTVEIEMIKPAPRLTTLEGKTIALRWNNKHNGDKVLDRIAEILKEKAPSAKVVKVYEVDPSTVRTSGSNQEAARIAKVMRDLKADLVIASQTD